MRRKRDRVCLGMLLAVVGMLLPWHNRARADGGASAVVVAYMKKEAGSFARQLATGWKVSYVAVQRDGKFHITFKNRIRNFGGLLVTPCWVDVKGNLARGQIHSIRGRGSEVAQVAARTLDRLFKAATSRFRAEWLRHLNRPRAGLNLDLHGPQDRHPDQRARTEIRHLWDTL